MAYLTLTNLNLTEAQLSSLNTYVDSETTAGNTDGIITNVTRNGVDIAGTVPAEPMGLVQRSWKDSASANAYINFVGALGGTVNYTAVINPL